MLSVIGEAPVASLADTDLVPDAGLALNILTFQCRKVQGRGWDWNTEESYALSMAVDGTVTLPPNTLKVKAADACNDYVARDGKLYDRTNKTFTFTAQPVVTITFGYDFEELPESARAFVAAIAGKIFEARSQGDTALGAEEDKEVLSAWAALLQEECETEQFDVMTQSPTVGIRKRWRLS